MKTNQTVASYVKMFGIGFIAILLCLCTAAPSAQSLIAYAESDAAQTAADAEYTEEIVRTWYYKCATRLDPDDENSPIFSSGSRGVTNSGGLTSLSGLERVNAATHSSYISAENESAFLSTTDLAVFGSKGAAASGFAWWTLYVYEMVPVVQPVVMDEPEIALPETESIPEEPSVSVSPVTPVATPDTMSDVAPDTVQVQQPIASMPSEPMESSPRVTSESEPIIATNEAALLSLQCRESEADAKAAELEAQGYEIVSVEKLPRWWR